MPTNQNNYNSRVTDEALEKKFRDTFRSQGGAELVDDLYASGVIIPVVDFTSAAEGSALRSDLQTAWDFATTHYVVNSGGGVVDVATTPGFWKVDLTAGTNFGFNCTVRLQNAGGVNKIIWQVGGTTTGVEFSAALEETFVVFLRTGDKLQAANSSPGVNMNIWTRQLADVYGNLTNPLGFTSS